MAHLDFDWHLETLRSIDWDAAQPIRESQRIAAIAAIAAGRHFCSLPY